MTKLVALTGVVAMFALCAQATDTTTTTLGSEDFESYDVGTFITPTNCWTGTAGSSEIVADGDNKYLAVDTESDLTNSYKDSPKEIGTGDITVSTKVQFTRMDEKPEVGTTDKILVWANADGKVCVTSKGDDGATVTTTDTIVAEDYWYELSIKATVVDFVTKFTVSIGGNEVKVNGAAATFTSLISGNTIASVTFKGTGAVDDIAFTKTSSSSEPTIEGGEISQKEDGTYVVTPNEGVTAIEVSGLPTGSTVEIPGSVETIKGTEGCTLIIKNKKDGVSYNITDALTIIYSDGTATITLNPGAKVTVEGKEIPVTPELKDSVTVEGEEVAPFDGAGTIGVATIPGLNYQMLGGDKPNDVSNDASDKTMATSAAMKLKNEKFKPTGSKAFFKVQVTK